MPNLVPLSLTPSNTVAFFASVRAFSTLIERTCAEPLMSAIGNVQQRRESWLPAVRAFVSPESNADLSHLLMPETRRGSSLTSGKATDTDVRLAQYVRISGLRGVAVLTRGEGREHGIRLTAKGTNTRNVPIEGAGLCPSERCNLIPPSEDDTLTSKEYYFLRRYRDSKKGAAFAESMESERRERDRAFWRAASPWWPLDKAGRFQSGKVRTNPTTGRETLRFLDGSYLDDRITAHKLANVDHYERVESKRERLSRDAELALLIAEQAADRKAQRKGRII